MDKLVKDGNVEIPDENLRPLERPPSRGTNPPAPQLKMN
jgi:hypothetical protein